MSIEILIIGTIVACVIAMPIPIFNCVLNLHKECKKAFSKMQGNEMLNSYAWPMKKLLFKTGLIIY